MKGIRNLSYVLYKDHDGTKLLQSTAIVDESALAEYIMKDRWKYSWSLRLGFSFAELVVKLNLTYKLTIRECSVFISFLV